MEELWKQISGWEGIYEISNLGRVKSLSRIVYRGKNKDKHILKERILKSSLDSRDRFIVILCDGKEKRENHTVSRLVAVHFIENVNNYSDINHIDGNSHNDHVNNLEWCTRAYNIQHAWDNGLIKRYKTHLSDLDIKKIRLYNKYGCNQKLLSEMFNCSWTHISNVCNNHTRTDVLDDLDCIIG